MTEERLAARGIGGFTWPLKVSCKNHEGNAPGVFIQQWDGKKWKLISDFIPAMSDVVRPMVEKAAAAWAVNFHGGTDALQALIEKVCVFQKSTGQDGVVEDDAGGGSRSAA